ncbi:MAG: AAA family ATPase [Salibacteraceae bacterium]
MSRPRTYATLDTLLNRLDDELNQGEIINQPRTRIEPVSLLLIYAYNRTGKTRLSRKFKEKTKSRNNGVANTLYFNSYTEDLFTWDNDLENDSDRFLNINPDSEFFSGIEELSLEPRIEYYLNRYAEFRFDIDYQEWKVTFSKDREQNIKISRGEENLFIWCFFMAVCELVIDGDESYDWVDYIYIDDPVSSLDDNNAIAVAYDLANLLKAAPSRVNNMGEPAPIKAVISSHHSLFFNVICNELRSMKHRKFFIHQPNGQGRYTLRKTTDTPYFHHIAALSELKSVVESDSLHYHHFNSLRCIMEKTSSFFGHANFSKCLEGHPEKELFARALNLRSHESYAIYHPTEMTEEDKAAFNDILTAFLGHYDFDLPEILGVPTPPATP